MKRKVTATTLIAALVLGVAVFKQIQTPPEPVVQTPHFVSHSVTVRDLFP